MKSIASDKLHCDYDNLFEYFGFIDKTMKFVEDFQLLKPQIWTLFAEQYIKKTDDEGGWKGEFWGKMMRGASLVYSYTKNPELYKVLRKSVCEMLSVAESTGRVSTYSENKEFCGWDLWCRKYVLLGMQYFLEICDEAELEKQIIVYMCASVDYIMDRIGCEDEKLDITSASSNWRGLNSSSILEPVVRLYKLTGEQKYFDFAKYIVEAGATDVANLFELAYKNELYPYQYPVTKAYEMISCFEGLLEFYHVTGNTKYKEALINFADKILESDFTIIGGAGCTHELFDHSSVRQANTTNGLLSQETCVTVTLMKFFYRMTCLTGKAEYADAFETSLYNAYLGSINTEKTVSPVIYELGDDVTAEAVAFDSYSPLTAGTRYNGVGGLQKIGGGKYYGCCACIGSAGVGLVPKMQLLSADDGFVMNLFICGKVETKLPSGASVTFETVTEYPADGAVLIKVSLVDPEVFKFSVRNPAWSKNTKVSLCGEIYPVTDGYITIDRTWKDGDTLTLEFDMRTRVVLPPLYETDILMTEYVDKLDFLVPRFDRQDEAAREHIALLRGPIALAQDERLGYTVGAPCEIDICDGQVFVTAEKAPYDSIVSLSIPLKNGEKMLLTDYATAGKAKDHGTKMAVWIRTVRK